MKTVIARSLAAATLALASAPAALWAHPHGGAGFPHEVLHLFLGRWHVLPALATALLGAGGALLVAGIARGLRGRWRATEAERETA